MIKNIIIAVGLTVGCVYVYFEIAPMAEQRLDTILLLAGFWLVSFFFMGGFASLIGLSIKSVLFAAIGCGMIYGATWMPDLPAKITFTILGAGIVLVALVTPFEAYFNRKRAKELEENGIEIEATVDEITKVRRHKDYYYFKTHWNDPETGETHEFKSSEFRHFIESSIKPGDSVKVRVNKNNYNHYVIDTLPYRDNSPGVSAQDVIEAARKITNK